MSDQSIQHNQIRV